MGAGSCYAFPVLSRQGGLSLAIPDGFLSEELLLDGSVDGYDGTVGPSKVFEATLLEEDESGTMAPTEFVKSFLVVDLKDDCLQDVQVYGDNIDPDQVVPFEERACLLPFPKLRMWFQRCLNGVMLQLRGECIFTALEKSRNVLRLQSGQHQRKSHMQPLSSS